MIAKLYLDWKGRTLAGVIDNCPIEKILNIDDEELMFEAEWKMQHLIKNKWVMHGDYVYVVVEEKPYTSNFLKNVNLYLRKNKLERILQ